MSASQYESLKPTGIFTATTAQEILQQFNDLVETKAKILLVDLSAVDFLDSSGLGTLVSMHTKMRLSGGKLYLCGAREQARCLFDISDMDQIFDIFESEALFINTVIKRNQAIIVQG